MNSRPGVTAAVDMVILLSEPEAERTRVFLRQDLSTSSGRVAQDKLTLGRTVQVRLGSNPLHAAQAPALRAVARCPARFA